ncbi:oxaloacetate decarboxylase [Ottowia sp.]|uniref:isocitrate lyase/PEP mutase family protein n=1 Tax=Ottowia sp. TaxID=1898956 RepID=UPI002C4BA3DF|nr:oxaloacetate decarboxylase [Ottowia sp.]MCP5256686.1 oxaloacetate decarboxylase [Burkholderiaceae bacterium]HPK32913.1 oxaloacetate decarboxylase [Ottowia sp.]HRW73066.1 oxaloacetate decarboxylase [Ottowia sp.]
MSDSRKTLRALAEARRAALLPGAFNALSARLIEDLGFEAVYITGAGVTNMSLGLPDQGFMGLAEIVEHTQRIRDAVRIPLIVDADTGFGNAVNVYHAVRQLERAGADCVQLEDQTSPKRCGHFNGKDVVDTEEMLGKIRAAVDARRDSGLLVMARTDAAAVYGFDAAVERAARFAEAGADILFVEALTEADQVRALPGLLDKPLLMNLVLGGKTPVLPREELATAGYGFVLYANAALQAAVAGMTRALTQLRERGELAEDPALVAPFAERQRLVNKPAWDELEQRYASR